MKIKVHYEWNEYANPPTPWATVTSEDGKLYTSGGGETFDEAKRVALDKLKVKANRPIPPDEEVEVDD